jgi:hypothetical protein
MIGRRFVSLDSQNDASRETDFPVLIKAGDPDWGPAFKGCCAPPDVFGIAYIQLNCRPILHL